MSSSTKETLRVGKQELQVSNLKKVLYPETGFTKGDAIQYYVEMASTILPHLKGRPLTLKRYPNGVNSLFFYEKRCPSHKPAWIKTVKVWSEGNQEDMFYCTMDGPAALAWVANLASLELHVLLSRAPKVDVPNFVAFDFDPGPPAGALEACEVLLMVKEVMNGLGLESFPKTSGGKGMHLYVPLNTPTTFDKTKHFAHELAKLLEREHPEQVTSNILKSKRTGKVFMDWSQNDSHKTTVCAYSLRARSHPTVSTPAARNTAQVGRTISVSQAQTSQDEGMK